eukprot:TRINITY_DN6056_c2_g1_i2.p1 TRINITY_DN6056_c2_g1~~TRINITY_DN6056_c2_g1_i2.p1  ORF type:complete len:752 (-),score=53.24 TRINITY_DN6056_c2_g1_i2:277-2532(-)
MQTQEKDQSSIQQNLTDQNTQQECSSQGQQEIQLSCIENQKHVSESLVKEHSEHSRIFLQQKIEEEELRAGQDQVQPRTKSFRFTSHRQRATNRKKQYLQPVIAPIYRRHDMVWQDNPARVLKYRPSSLHHYGWFPLFSLQNIQATVFSDPFLHFQTGILIAIMLAIHLTGLGLQEEVLRGFVDMFSSSYLGSIWHGSMIITFLLGLFMSEVYRRWWNIRTMYATLSSTTIDLCEMITNLIRNPKGNVAESRLINRARTELIRYLNLGHMMVITTAASQGRQFHRYPIQRKIKNFFKRRTVTAWKQETKNLSYRQLNNAGLVNWDEWELMGKCEGQGVPRYLTVYHWTQQLIHKVKQRGWLWNSQMLPPMVNKLSTIVESGQGIFTFINSQLPYPYVHLVSFATHLYLVLMAVYMGALLKVGLTSDKVIVRLTTAITASQQVVLMENKDVNPLETELWQNSTRENGLDVRVAFAKGQELHNKYFSAAALYFLMCVLNVVIQGLLNSHSLFDNPFGSHPSKFPLRLMATELINITRSLLKGADDLPEAFVDIFQPASRLSSFRENQGQEENLNSEDVQSKDRPASASSLRQRVGVSEWESTSDRVNFINPGNVLGQLGRESVIWGSGIQYSYASSMPGVRQESCPGKIAEYYQTTRRLVVQSSVHGTSVHRPRSTSPRGLFKTRTVPNISVLISRKNTEVEITPQSCNTTPVNSRLSSKSVMSIGEDQIKQFEDNDEQYKLLQSQNQNDKQH